MISTEVSYPRLSMSVNSACLSRPPRPQHLAYLQKGEPCRGLTFNDQVGESIS